MSYKIRTYKQLHEWVNGNSIHNTIDDECCPDFSCCNVAGKIMAFSSRASYRDKIRKNRRKNSIKNVSSL
jgi:hypothetical protein